MLILVQYNLVTLVAALLIGIVTGWWAFGRRKADQRNQRDSDPS
jgi:hypothetical protein